MLCTTTLLAVGSGLCWALCKKMCKKRKKKIPYKAFVMSCHFLCHFLWNPIWRICFCLGQSAWLRATQQKLFFFFFLQWFTFLVSAGFGLGPSSSSVLKDFSTLTSLEGCSKEWNSVVCSFAFFRNESQRVAVRDLDRSCCSESRGGGSGGLLLKVRARIKKKKKKD